MQDQNNIENKNEPELMDQQHPASENDIFLQFLGEDQINHSMETERPKHIHCRSTHNLNRRSDFRKILNSSSSNDRLIPSSIKNDSSRQNSEHDPFRMQTQNSKDSSSVRRSFMKKFQQSFSISQTIRDSSSSFSERSDSKSSRNIIIIPQVYQQQAIMEEHMSCNCKRSKCLKLYCECFQKQRFCSPYCHCHSCGNHAANIEQHKQAIIEALARNARAFEEENSNIPEKKKEFSLGYQPQEVRKGCKCKKTKCLKKYCECFGNGIPCTIFCRCEGCQNKEKAGFGQGTAQPSQQVILTKNI